LREPLSEAPAHGADPEVGTASDDDRTAAMGLVVWVGFDVADGAKRGLIATRLPPMAARPPFPMALGPSYGRAGLKKARGAPASDDTSAGACARANAADTAPVAEGGTFEPPCSTAASKRSPKDTRREGGAAPKEADGGAERAGGAPEAAGEKGGGSWWA
jgi:hypothetical protein